MAACALSTAVHAQTPPPPLDLNRASLEEILELPVPEDVARHIWEYRTYRRFFSSFYDLADVEGVTPEILKRLAPLVSTMPPDPVDEAIRRYDASFRQVQRFLSQEGASEELADEYLDQLREPRNVNDLTLYELQSFQNVSPVDAVAVLRARERTGGIRSSRQLRSSDGLTFWGYRNLRDYVVYETPREKLELRGDAQVVVFNTPYTLDERDLLLEPLPGRDPMDFESSTTFGVRGLTSANPAVLSKLRLRLGTRIKGGIMTFRDVGEDNLDETLKGFVSYRSHSTERLRLDKVVVGNYRLAFGQGLVMDNTDFFLPRKTGYGFNKRPLTLLGDLSRTQEFSLRGMAAQGTLGPVNATGFFSYDEKDGLLNPDGSINKYVVMLPRLENSELAAMSTEDGRPYGLRRDAFTERIYGGNVRVQIVPGTFVGLSGYEARYNKRFDPRISTLIPVGNQDLLDSRDSELFKDYDSTKLGKFRRVVGAEFQAVYENLALQGEYAKLDANERGGISGLFHSAPDAYLLTAYLQYSDFNVLALWRDYDLGFDNPYARAFSNDSRYEQTLVGDPFRLQNPTLTWLEQNTPQMKPERGLFLHTRYRVSRNFTITGLDYDQWTRVADGQELQRYTARMEYAPIFPLRFRLRQRFSSRSEAGASDVRRFRSWDTRLEMRVRLSGFDELRFLYSSTSTQFAPRPRLSGAAEPGAENPLPQAGSPSQAIQALLTHNVNDRLMFTYSTEVYDGFLWNFEDNEFIVLDDKGFRNWFLVRSRLSDKLLLRFKLTHDRNLSRTNLDVRRFNDPFGFRFEGDAVRRSVTSFRLQLDYTF